MTLYKRRNAIANQENAAVSFSVLKMILWLLLTLIVLADCENRRTSSCPDLCACSLSVLGMEVVCSQSLLKHFPTDGLPHNTTRLSIQSTNLSIITTSHLRVVPHLDHLQLYHTNLESIPSDLLREVPRLNALDLTGNKLVHLPPNVFSYAPLGSLVLKNNLIETVDADWFHPNSSLTWLDLSGNRLATVPSALFQKLPHLQNLDLSHNRLQELQPDMLNPLHHLETVNLAANELSTLKPGTFTNNRRLIQLFLQENRIRELPPALLGSLQYLQLLLLNQNQLQNLPSGLLGQLGQQEQGGSQVKVILAGNPWVCDAKMEYLWKWLTFYAQNVFFLEEVTCARPAGLEKRQVASLTENELGLAK